MNEKNGNVFEEMKNIFVEREIEEKILERREIFLWDEVNDRTARSVVQKILFFDGESKKDITLYINSPGGSITAGLAIYDAMQYADSDISTICMGQAASMGAVLLCAGKTGKRYAWKHSRIMIHQPLLSGQVVAPASDLQIQAEEILRLREKLNMIISEHTGKKLADVEEDTDRDFFLSAQEAKDYGLIDKITD